MILLWLLLALFTGISIAIPFLLFKEISLIKKIFLVVVILAFLVFLSFNIYNFWIADVSLFAGQEYQVFLEIGHFSATTVLVSLIGILIYQFVAIVRKNKLLLKILKVLDKLDKY